MSTTVTTTYDFDLIVIGGGSGGLACAKRAVNHKKRVAVCDFVKPTAQGTKWNLGGTCVNVGCVPKKLMHFASLMGEAREDQNECGWNVDTKKQHNWEAMLKNVNRHVRSNQYGIKFEIIGKGIEYYKCLAEFVDPHKIKQTNLKGEVSYITGETVVIAVGGRPKMMDSPGFKEHAITSDDLFWKKTDPGKSLVIGGGYVALECGGFIKTLGNDVDVLIRSTPLSTMDEDMKKRVVKQMDNAGINFITKYDSSKQQSIKKREDGRLDVEFSAEDTLMTGVYDTVIVAIGREADVKGLNLAAANVKVNSRNKIISNNLHTTSQDNVFAIGDCIDISPELTPVAIMEAVLLAERLYNNGSKVMDYDIIPTTVFTPLEYSMCGLSGAAAIKKYGDENVEEYHTTFKPLEWEYLSSRPGNLCYVKAVVLSKQNNKVIGQHYCGPNAGEVMQGYATAMMCGCTLEHIQNTVGIHPTTAEVFTGLKYTKKEMPEVVKTSC